MNRDIPRRGSRGFPNASLLALGIILFLAVATVLFFTVFSSEKYQFLVVNVLILYALAAVIVVWLSSRITAVSDRLATAQGGSLESSQKRYGSQRTFPTNAPALEVVEQLAREIRMLQADLAACQSRLDALDAAGSKPPAASIERPNEQPLASSTPKGPLESFIDAYNRSLKSIPNQTQFRQQYLEDSRLGLSDANAMARKENPAIKPDFVTISSGIYGVYKIQGKYYVVPKFDNVIDDTNYGTGAMSSLFTIDGFQRGMRYTSYKLATPTIVAPQGDGRWRIERMGLLVIS